MIAPHDPFYEEPSTPRPELRSSSITPLQGFVIAIRASSFFHLFSEEEQLTAARQLTTLFYPCPGSIIFGRQCLMSRERERIITLVPKGPCSVTLPSHGEIFGVVRSLPRARSASRSNWLRGSDVPTRYLHGWDLKF
ncbi:hypothetical protein JOM56_002686 [Amanita muscaria]